MKVSRLQQCKVIPQPPSLTGAPPNATLHHPTPHSIPPQTLTPNTHLGHRGVGRRERAASFHSRSCYVLACCRFALASSACLYNRSNAVPRGGRTTGCANAASDEVAASYAVTSSGELVAAAAGGCAGRSGDDVEARGWRRRRSPVRMLVTSCSASMLFCMSGRSAWGKSRSEVCASLVCKCTFSAVFAAGC